MVVSFLRHTKNRLKFWQAATSFAAERKGRSILINDIIDFIRSKGLLGAMNRRWLASGFRLLV